MASITINIPDAVATRVTDAVAARYGWSTETGLTKVQFAKRIIVNLLKDTVKMHEGQLASATASQAASNAVDNEVNIT